MSVIILTTGVPGCGKTYVRCARFLVDDFLVNTKGVHISNFPVNVDEVASAVCKKINKNRGFFGIFRKKVTEKDIKKRIVVIADSDLQKWRTGESGPWDYFAGSDLKYAHIAIDEIHNFINSRISPEVLRKWDDFLGEVRHRGCTFEGLTQDIDQVDRVLIGRAALRLELIPGEDLRDPFFKIKMSDWYELKAGFTGSYHKTVFMFEKRKQGSYWKTNHVSRFLITPEYFKYYNSFNASLQEKEQGASDEGRAVEYEYQRRNKISLLFWFIRRNWFTLFWRLLVLIVVVWFTCFGGISWVLSGWLDASKGIAKVNTVQDTKSKKQIKKTVPQMVSAGSDKKISVPKSASVQPSVSLKEKKEQELKKELLDNGFKPGLFFEGKCWLRNGVRIHEGFKFNDKKKHGDFYEREVKKIDASERYYILDDGTIHGMY